jgi:hypothetical protein
MPIISETIRTEPDGSISFGDYEAEEKKKADLEMDGSQYRVKTHTEITRIEKDGMLLMETVPGTAVHNLTQKAGEISFNLEGREDTRITLELEPEAMYRILIDGTNIGNVKSNLAGKVIFSMELDAAFQHVSVKKT